MVKLNYVTMTDNQIYEILKQQYDLWNKSYLYAIEISKSKANFKKKKIYDFCLLNGTDSDFRQSIIKSNPNADVEWLNDAIDFCEAQRRMHLDIEYCFFIQEMLNGLNEKVDLLSDMIDAFEKRKRDGE